MPTQIESLKIICKGGQTENLDVLTTGLQPSGVARRMVNYEPALEGGYQRIKGYSKFSTSTVTGDPTSPILGVKVAHSGVYAARKNVATTGVNIYYSTSGAWSAALVATPLSASTTKVRFIGYSITEPVVIATNGYDQARKFDASQVETVLTDGPTAPKYGAMIRNRLVLAPASTSSSIAISAANDDEAYTSGGIEINVGDTITGLKTFREKLYIFCQNSIFRLDGTTTSDFAIVPITRSLGCISHDSIQETAGDLTFLFTDGLHSLAATERVDDLELGIISPQIQPTLRDLIEGVTEDEVSSCLIRGKSQYRLFIQDATIEDDLDSNGIGAKYNRDGTIEFYELQGFNSYSADSEYLNTGTERAVFGHPTNGFVYLQESGNTLGGTTKIPHLVSFIDQMMGDDKVRKVLQKITLYMQAGSTETVNLQATLDFSDPDKLQPQSVPITVSGSTATYGSAVYGVDTYGSVTLAVIRKQLIGSCYAVGINIYGNSNSEPYRIDSMVIQYSIKGKKEFY
jgi:hypothetical protein